MLQTGQKYLPVFGAVAGATDDYSQSISPPFYIAVMEVKNSGFSNELKFHTNYLVCGKIARLAVD